MDKFFTEPGIFTPEGRLNQIEYAIQAVETSNNLIAIRTNEGFIIGTEIKNEMEIEDEKKYPRNIFLIDKHIIIGVTGNIPDSQVIINHVRKQAQQYRFVYQEDIPINDVIHEICNIKQQFSQSKTSRPFGCSLIVAGWDRFRGLQLVKTDPSGIFSVWKAVSIGANNLTNQTILDCEYNDRVSTPEALAMLVRIIRKKASHTLPSKIYDIHTCTFDHGKNLLIHRLSKKELNSLIKL